MKKKVGLISGAVTLILGAIVSSLVEAYAASIFPFPAVVNVIIISILALIAVSLIQLLIWFIGYLIKVIKSKDSKTILDSIDDIGHQYKLPAYREEQSPFMFDVVEEDKQLIANMESDQRWLKKKFANSKHVIYHSTTAKGQVNWVEFVFWHFLSRLKNELGCEILISLHYDEDSRQNGLITPDQKKRHEHLFKYYSEVAHIIIGKDVTIYDEERYHEKKSKNFSTDFHNIFVSEIIKYFKIYHQNTNQKITSLKKDLTELEISQEPICSEDIEKIIERLSQTETEYKLSNEKDFLRRISYIESVFPIMSLMKYPWNRGRLYVLDRELANEVWSTLECLRIFKARKGIIFITAQTLKDKYGIPLRIFKAKETINLTDTRAVYEEKINNLDYETQRAMYSLLSSCLGEEPEELPDDDLKQNIIRIISSINERYHFPQSIENV